MKQLQTLFFKLKTVETDGYNAIQVGFDDKREVLSNKPAKGHVAKANTAPKRFIREFKNIEGLEVGAEITVDTFEAGDVVDVTGTSKGKGFQGVIKRHGQSRGPMGSRFTLPPSSWFNGTSCAKPRVQKQTLGWTYGWRPCNDSKP